MPEQKLKIPYAYEGDGVTVITPERAVSGTSYYCPSCNQGCTVRRGDIKVAHFGHLPKNKACSISRETYEHRQAKLLIYNALSEEVMV